MRCNVCLPSLRFSVSFVIDYFHSRVTIYFRSRVNKHFPSRHERVRALDRYETLFEKARIRVGMIETSVDIARDVCFSAAFIAVVYASPERQ